MEGSSTTFGKTSQDLSRSSLFATMSAYESDMSMQSTDDEQLLDQVYGGSWIRGRLFEVTQSNYFSSFILLVILLNTVILALETVSSFNHAYSWWISILDSACLGIYMAECALKLFAWRLYYFKSTWNVFDFAIVAISIFTWLTPYYFASLANFNTEIFRVLRLFRAHVAIVANYHHHSFKSIPAMFNIAALSLVSLYILAVFATATYRDVDPRRFGFISTALFRLFQLMTLDKWSNIVNENREKSKTIQYFVVFVIVLETFVFLNLFIAVIVNNLQTARKLINIKRQAKTQRNIGEVGSVDSFEQALRKSKGANVHRESTTIGKMEDELLKEGIVEELLGIENYYSAGLPQRTKELLSGYFMHLSSLEYNLSLYEKQQKILDELVDIAKEK
ncbi:voltage-gated potassium channel [Rhizoclosmatium globosum]|uniref:Voltage-gated potassium channel n=1 Tax=Rhizoclosmatium globosum TaxID=329046 RepID=A0A1Y2C9T2_9FUNG|nr:voltage-gated potassium channel [Rhizoclosmatium globosum]|eukprot:ORY43798.1 voltage-gated potassium channel [Rhizoclosmatium globosum]